jgi:hypothetical protein
VLGADAVGDRVIVGTTLGHVRYVCARTHVQSMAYACVRSSTNSVRTRAPADTPARTATSSSRRADASTEDESSSAHDETSDEHSVRRKRSSGAVRVRAVMCVCMCVSVECLYARVRAACCAARAALTVRCV